MPQKKISPEPPVMTWSKATPVLVVCIIFDAVRLMFEMFWFFGPALAALFCTIKAGAVVGTTLGGLACGAVAVAAGIAAAAAVETFGVVMAMATGFAGWLIIGLWLMLTNARIFKENALWFVGSLAISEIPFVGSIPAITISVWRMYSNQIKIEKAAYAKWKKETAAARLQQRNQQAAQAAQQEQLMQIQDNQLAPADVY